MRVLLCCRVCGKVQGVNFRCAFAAVLASACTQSFYLRGRNIAQFLHVRYRAYTKQKADELGLTGFVQNEPDGSVRGVAEGRADALEVGTKTMIPHTSDAALPASTWIHYQVCMQTMKEWLKHTGSPASRIDSTNFDNEAEMEQKHYPNFSITISR